jgi:hypothetical protein
MPFTRDGGDVASTPEAHWRVVTPPRIAESGRHGDVTLPSWRSHMRPARQNVDNSRGADDERHGWSCPSTRRSSDVATR